MFQHIYRLECLERYAEASKALADGMSAFLEAEVAAYYAAHQWQIEFEREAQAYCAYDDIPF